MTGGEADALRAMNVSIIREAAELLRRFACAPCDKLPEGFRWPLMDELDGIAAALTRPAQAESGEAREADIRKLRQYATHFSACDGSESKPDSDCGCGLLNTLRRLAAAPKPAQAESGEAREGFVLVPRVPTEDMTCVGFESEPDENFSSPEEWAAYEAMTGCQQGHYRAGKCWAAMIARHEHDSAAKRDAPSDAPVAGDAEPLLHRLSMVTNAGTLHVIGDFTDKAMAEWVADDLLPSDPQWVKYVIHTMHAPPEQITAQAESAPRETHARNCASRLMHAPGEHLPCDCCPVLAETDRMCTTMEAETLAEFGKPAQAKSGEAREAVERWLDRDWPLWRNDPDGPAVQRLRRAWDAAQASQAALAPSDAPVAGDAVPVAWLHTIRHGDDPETDQALSFAADNFPLGPELGYHSLGVVPLYTHPSEAETIGMEMAAWSERMSGPHDSRMVRRLLAEWAERLAAAPKPAQGTQAVGDALPFATVCLPGERYANGHMIEVQLQIDPMASVPVGMRLYAESPTPARSGEDDR